MREKFERLKGRKFKRRTDGQVYTLGTEFSTDWKNRRIVQLSPVWSGRTHWKTWGRFLAEYCYENGAPL